MGTNGSARKGLPSGNDDDGPPKVTPMKKEKSGSGTIKLKKPAPKHSKPGNWRDGSVIDDEKKKGTSTPNTRTSSPAPPVVNQLDDHARDTFPTGRPMEDSVENLICKHCKKNVLKSAVTEHLVKCLKQKREKALKKKEQKEAREREKKEAERGQESDGDGSGDDVNGANKGTKKGAGKKVEGDDKKGKKRKADGEGEKGPSKKKKKEELKIKAPKAKGPVDVERQCGVLKDGVACARSLTCKSHSMGAKRAVPGRSLPYDMLLAAYQKKNQAKQQKAAIDANAPLEDEDAGAGPVDSDEELTAVMAGLANWQPQPAVPPLVHVPIETTFKRQRLYEQLHSATNGFTVNIFKVVGLGAQKLPQEDEENGDNHPDGMQGLVMGMQSVAQRRASGFNMQLPPRRQASMQKT